TWIFDSTFSVINWTLKAAGLLHGWLYWLGEPALALLAIIIVQAWRIFPFATVIVLAGLSSIPQEIVEAAIVDGAGFWRRLFQIELPLLLPVVTVAVLFGVVYTATDLGVVYILTGGGPANTTHVLPTLPFQPGFRGVASEPRALDLQRPAHARARPAALRTNRLPALGPEHPGGGCGGRRHHRGRGGAGRLQPGPARRPLGGADGDGHLLHLSHPPHALVRPVLAAHLPARPPELPGLVDPDLPDHDDPVLHVARDGIPPVRALGDRGAGHDRRLQPPRGHPEGRAPAHRAGDPHGDRVHVHPGD